MTTQPFIEKNFYIDLVKITRTDGKVENLDQGSVIQLEYREGLFNKFISVTLVISDTTSGITDELTGMEKVELKFTDRSNKISYDFTQNSTNGPLYAYRIHNRKVVDTAKIVAIELCRLDAINSMQIRVCKKYEKVKATGLIGDIIVNVLGSKKTITAEDSTNKISFIPPNSRPLDVLIWARNKFIGNAQSPRGKYKSAGYLFYENYNRYVYQSVDKIAEANNVEYKQVYVTGTGIGGTDDIYRFENVEFVSNIDMIENFDRGFYSGIIDFFDIVNCSVTTKKYSLNELYSGWTKINLKNKKLPSTQNEATEENLKEGSLEQIAAVESQYATRSMTVSYNRDLFLGSTDDADQDRSEFENTVLQSVSRLGIFTNQVLTATANVGNMALNIGDPIRIEFYSPSGKIDKKYSGRYLISGLTHLYTRKEEKYQTFFTLIRDSFGL